MDVTTIRRATRADSDGICRVHVDAVRHFCTLHYTSQEIEAWIGRLRPGAHEPEIDALPFFVAIDGENDVVGFAVFDPAAEEVRAVYVHPTASGRGIGRALLGHIETIARELGVTKLSLEASLNSADFYSSAGFEPVETRRHQLEPGLGIRCVFMTKSLAAPAIGGAPSGDASADMPVFLVPPDESWPDRFQEERRAIVQALGDRIVAVEHVGSTAIPGIVAKPVIDLMVLVASIAEAPTLFDPLERLHYHYFPYAERRTPERRWFYKPDRRVRTHHLHLVEAGSAHHGDLLTFRDYLRSNRDEAARYESLKTTLAASFPNDRERYTDGKAEFVRDVLAKAAT